MGRLLVIYMTLQLLHSEVPYIYEENLIFFFISVLLTRHNLSVPRVGSVKEDVTLDPPPLSALTPPSLPLSAPSLSLVDFTKIYGIVSYSS